MRHHRVILAAAAVSLSLGLSGCAPDDFFDKVQDSMADFNPFGTAKKPLPGERRAVFPQGVPGIQQGVPSDLVKGNQPAADDPPAAAEPPKSKSKKKKTSDQSAQ